MASVKSCYSHKQPTGKSYLKGFSRASAVALSSSPLANSGTSRLFALPSRCGEHSGILFSRRSTLETLSISPVYPDTVIGATTIASTASRRSCDTSACACGESRSLPPRSPLICVDRRFPAPLEILNHSEDGATIAPHLHSMLSCHEFATLSSARMLGRHTLGGTPTVSVPVAASGPQFRSTRFDGNAMYYHAHSTTCSWRIPMLSLGGTDYPGLGTYVISVSS